MVFGGLGSFQVVCLDFLLGFFRKQIGEFKGEVTKKELIVFNIVQIVSNLVIWGLIAPVGDVLIYKESANKVLPTRLLLRVHLMH